MLSTLKLFTLATIATSALGSKDICFFLQGNSLCNRDRTLHYCCPWNPKSGECCTNPWPGQFCHHIGVFGLAVTEMAHFYNKVDCRGGMIDEAGPAGHHWSVCTQEFSRYRQNRRMTADNEWRCSAQWTRSRDGDDDTYKWPKLKEGDGYVPPDDEPKPPEPEPERSSDRPPPAIEMRPAGPYSGRNGTRGGRPGVKRGDQGMSPVPTKCSLPTIAGYVDDKGKMREISFREDQFKDVAEMMLKSDWKGLAKYPDSGRPVPGSEEWKKQEQETAMRLEKEWKEHEEAKKAAAQKVAKL